MENIIIYLLKSSLILSLFALFYAAFLKKETFFRANRWYFIVGIGSAVGLPLLYFTQIVWVDPIEPVTVMTNQQLVPMVQTETVSETPFSPNWWLAGGVVYAVGVLVMLSRLGIQLLSLQKLLKRNLSFQKEGVIYTEVADTIAPFSFGNHLVYNPNLHSEKELDIIIRHELEHINQRHSIDLLLANILLAMHWFNPLAWFYKNALEQNLEYLADHQTLNQDISKRDYQLALVKVTTTNRYPEITTNFYQSFTSLTFFGRKFTLKKPFGQVKKRIAMLNSNTSHNRNLLKFSLIIPLLVVFIFIFNIKTVAQVKPSEKKTKDTMTVKIKNYNTSKDSLGENSLYIINGKKLKKLDYKGKTISADSVKVYSGKEAIEKYGESAKDGAIVFNGKTKIVSTDVSSTHLTNHKMNVERNEIFKSAGENPLFIINGKPVDKNKLVGKTLVVEKDITKLDAKTAQKQYGNKGKDGVFILNGKTTVTTDFEEAVELLKKNKSAIGFSINETKVPQTTKVDSNRSTIKSNDIEPNNKNEATNTKVTGATYSYFEDDTDTISIQIQGAVLKTDSLNFKLNSVRFKQPDTLVLNDTIYSVKGNVLNSSSNKNKKLYIQNAAIADYNMVLTVEKTATDADLDGIIKLLDSYGVDANFKRVKRKNGVLTGIKVDLDYEGSSKTYSSSNTEGIENIYITFNKTTKQLSVGEAKVKISNRINGIIYDSGDNRYIDNYEQKISDNAFQSFDNKTIYQFYDDNPDIYISGKKVSKESLTKLDPSKIDKVNIVKKEDKSEIWITLKED